MMVSINWLKTSESEKIQERMIVVKQKGECENRQVYKED